MFTNCFRMAEALIINFVYSITDQLYRPIALYTVNVWNVWNVGGGGYGGGFSKVERV